jgi:hypothetical protein
MRLHKDPVPDDRDRGGLAEDVVELSLLLTARQLRALVAAASRQEMSAGQLLRWLTQEYLHGLGFSPAGKHTATPRGTTVVSPSDRRSIRIDSWQSG